VPLDRRGDIVYYNLQVNEKNEEGKNICRVYVAPSKETKLITPVGQSQRAQPRSSWYVLTIADEANFMTADITEYYINTQLLRPEYMRMTRKQISPTIMAEYDLKQYFNNNKNLDY
jgi:hypothetical protein